MNIPSKVLDWLLETENPAVRYFTLVDLLDQPGETPEVSAARQAIMTGGDAPLLLEGQAQGGYWGQPGSFYSPRFTSAAWRFMLLAEFGAAGADPRIRQTASYLFEQAQLANGGFSCREISKRAPDDRGLPCLTGNMVWSYIRLGYLDDPHVQKGVEWLVKYSRFDDGDTTSWPDWLPQDPDDACWGRHTCFRGMIAGLQALSEIPPERRSAQVRQTLAAGVEYLLIHHIYKHSHDLSKSVASYTQVGFPLFADNDLLRMLLVLTKLGIHDLRMQEAVDCLARKQDKLGRWKQQHVYPHTRVTGFMPVPITPKGQPSKWITLKALTVLKRYGAG